MSTYIKFLNLWPELLDYKYHRYKNNETQFSSNQTLKNEIE